MFNFKKLFNRETYNPLTPELIGEYNKHRPMGPQPYLCYAPFKSIYFGHLGKAVACCYNRNHVLGTYPQQSIKQIWFGEEADKLREYIKHNDLSLGCLGCKQHITGGNFDAVKTLQYDERTLNKNKYPSVMEFELSNVCNLECAMCNGNFSSLIRAKRENLPPLEIPYNSAFVDQLEEFIPYLDEVKFYGGEPFLVDIYYDIWERILRINPKVRISVQTNGTTLNSRLKELMEGIDFHINVSFDSLKKDVYEEIRKNAVYERVRENINYFREYTKRKNTFFGISVCAMQQNRFEIPDFINFCNQLDAPVYFHTVMYPEHCSIHNLSAEQLDEIVDYLKGFNFPEETSVQKKNAQHYRDLLSQIVQWQAKATRRIDTSAIKTFADLEKLIITHVRNDKAAVEGLKQARIEKIETNLQNLKAKLPVEMLNQLITRFDVNDPFLLDNAAFFLEKLSVDDLLAKYNEIAQK
ncbi:MAG: radical SAM protein [Chitinophagales bacterium]